MKLLHRGAIEERNLSNDLGGLELDRGPVTNQGL